MNFKSESTLVTFEEGAGNNLNTVIKSLQAVQRRSPDTIVTVGVPIDNNQFEPKPLNAILELNFNGTNQLVFTENKSLSSGETLARAVLKAARIREESFDLEAAQKATEKHIASGTIYDLPFYEDYYRLTKEEACELIEPASLRMPVYLLLATNWNDVLEWAKDTVKDVTDNARSK